MLKGNELIGMPVVAYDTGEQIRTVQDLIFDHKSNLLGFLVNEKQLLRGAQVLPLHGIKVIGPDVIIALSQSAIVKADQVPEIREVLSREMVLQGTEIVTEEGCNLGTITDLYFDKHTGAIEGYEVKGGPFAQESFGYSFVPAPQNLKMGDHVAFVPNETAEMMTEKPSGGVQPRGYQVPVAATPASLGGTQEQSPVAVGAKKYNSHLAPTEALMPTANGRGDAANCWEGEAPSFESLLGRRVRQSLKAEDHQYIAVMGQIVTQKVMDRACAYRQESDLLAAVYCYPTPEEQGYMGDRASQEQWVSQNRPVTKKRSHLWQPWQKLSDRIHQSIETWQIKRAIGCSVNRVILDQQDRQLLGVGELITYKTIAAARQANVLDVLLSSVSHPNSRQQR